MQNKYKYKISFPVVLPAGWTEHSSDATVLSHLACWAGPFSDVAVRVTCIPVTCNPSPFVLACCLVVTKTTYGTRHSFVLM